jgi:hypothetical protein
MESSAMLGKPCVMMFEDDYFCQPTLCLEWEGSAFLTCDEGLLACGPGWRDLVCRVEPWQCCPCALPPCVGLRPWCLLHVLHMALGVVVIFFNFFFFCGTGV